jgi:hypothetical protein
MRVGRAAWALAELLLPALLVGLSVVLLAAAVGATLLGADDGAAWRLFGEGVACWVTGIALGWVANGRGARLRGAA